MGCNSCEYPPPPPSSKRGKRRYKAVSARAKRSKHREEKENKAERSLSLSSFHFFCIGARSQKERRRARRERGGGKRTVVAAAAAAVAAAAVARPSPSVRPSVRLFFLQGLPGEGGGAGAGWPCGVVWCALPGVRCLKLGMAKSRLLPAREGPNLFILARLKPAWPAGLWPK